MSRFSIPILVTLLACAAGSAGAQARPLTPAEVVRADSGRPPYTEADVHFMSGMIAHHAQAVRMASWAPSRSAGPSVRALCERIVVAQRDEIALMQQWLKDRSLPVPDPDPRGHRMPGMDHHVLMPGMLSPAQMDSLGRARGAEFDRLFLAFMIQHHEGALTMVEQLIGSAAAAQDDSVFKLAADISADQTAEIDRMYLMLAALSPTQGNRNR
ncbi:MAG: DUF305 domain-containing protein [Gemmatimonadales bacterium]